MYKDTALVKYKNTDSSSLKKAEIFWLQHIQIKHFKDITEFLTKLKGNLLRSISGKKLIRDQKLCPPELCRDLHLFLDSDGLIRVHTSAAEFRSLTYDQKFPILLPNKDNFVYLIAKSAHSIVGHMGLKSTMANLRNKFWIVNYTAVIKKMIKQCQVYINKEVKNTTTQLNHPYRISDSI